MPDLDIKKAQSHLLSETAEHCSAMMPVMGRGTLTMRAEGSQWEGLSAGLYQISLQPAPLGSVSSPVNDPCLACLTRASYAPEVRAMSKLWKCLFPLSTGSWGSVEGIMRTDVEDARSPLPGHPHPSCRLRWLLTAHSCTHYQRPILHKSQPGGGTLPPSMGPPEPMADTRKIGPLLA